MWTQLLAKSKVNLRDNQRKIYDTPVFVSYRKRKITYVVPTTLCYLRILRFASPVRQLMKCFQICGEDRYYKLDQTPLVNGAALAFVKQELMGKSSSRVP